VNVSVLKPFWRGMVLMKPGDGQAGLLPCIDLRFWIRTTMHRSRILDLCSNKVVGNLKALPRMESSRDF
jgi:hypothetical protein